MSSILSGAAFGAALVTAGVYKPSVIISQFKFENYHMLQAFLAATASSTLAVALMEKLNYAQCKPRSSASLGLVSRYDGNIIGGSLLGIGMAISGACPGTALVQAAVGIRSGFYAIDGGLLAGIAWTGFLGPWVERRKKKYAPAEPATVYEDAHISKTAALLSFEAVCVAIIAATILYTPESTFAPLVAPVLGGLIIGGAQLFSLLSRRSVVGVSTVYEDVGKHFWWLLRGADTGKTPTGYSHVLFSAGIVSGAWALAKALPQVAANADIGVSPAMATLGGALIILGARTAGGCTSGHGISGVSLLSTSSFVTVMSMFGAAALAAPYLH